MPSCKKCEKPFPNRVTIRGVLRNIGRRRYCLGCSPFGQHNTRDPRDPKSKWVCKACALPFEYKRSRGDRRDICNTCINKKQREQMKRRAVEHKGGKCQGCSYATCFDALVFHHVDPKHKEFGIGGSANRAWIKIKAELEKCVLLCTNCHAEIHAGVREVPSASS